MTDLTPTLTELLQQRQNTSKLSTGYMTTEIADEFLKEAYRINTHITSLLTYLQTIRPSYLSLTKPKSTTTTTTTSPSSPTPKSETLTDSDRDSITASTSTLLSNLSTSLRTLSSAESLRQETVSRTLDKKFKRSLLAKWADGKSLTTTDSNTEGKSEEEVLARETERILKCVRESILWYLSRKLGDVVNVQRDLVERRVERVRERERSVLYNLNSGSKAGKMGVGMGLGVDGMDGIGVGMAAKMDQDEVRAIEAELTPQQLQLFEEENENMVRYFEDVVGKVQNAEKSLLEISSLQQTLVSHLATQEEYIGQLVTDASNTRGNIGEGNKELKRATERRSAAQAVFWGTVGLCTWLVVWDLAF
ncbi:putative snare protein [Aspergillus sclerotioniger CBS 115572]|uniref:Putative snare protein n=1 Tax=Aspergillus sclerotioniger CBS 115572 TaxID=1450535 RepID=A0A317VKW3_9EURO|nr:putative snare protein [Aspergillus sclerotioniger CBS 115572]PWY74535.1 putative snare protein [Aspergillus sclerotioniger CBS 115572]